MRRWFAGLVTALMVAGCSLGSDGDDTAPIATMALVSFDACADVLDHLKSEARDRVGPFGLGPDEIFATDDRAMEFDAGAEASAPAPASRAYSTTNVQEIGVDEPDVVKTDGRLLVTVTGTQLRVIDVSGPAPREIGRLPLADGEYVDATLLLAGDKVLVLIREQPVVPYAGIAEDTSSDAAPLDVLMKSVTKVLLVGLSDPAMPVVESTLEIDGHYLDARMVDETVRLVVSSAPSLAFPTTDTDWSRPEDELVARNREIVDNSTIEDWLPSYRLTGPGASSGQLVSCDQLRRPDEFAGFSTMSVLTFDLADGLTATSTVGVLTDGDTVYASTDRLYVATSRWHSQEPVDRATVLAPSIDPRTGIHVFDISEPGPARYVASGEVAGRIIGRYAMSEHEGILRVATTVESTPVMRRSTLTSESQLVTLEERGDQLVHVGQVGGLGKGEQIYAVRYFGDVGYVVTFRQVDPLYVLDLSDPSRPAVTGELKITGYSAYLHDVGSGRLVGVGQEATSDGRVVGAQVSLFDVRDPAAPAKLAGHVVPNAWSQAEWDPHAFLYWPDTSQLVVPIDGMSGGGGALVVRVGPNSVTEQGTITRGATPSADVYDSISRTVVVGETLYTLWADGLQANRLDDLSPQGWLSFT